MSANKIVIGNGSGQLAVTGMNGLNPGDTVAINPGTYAWSQFNNLNGITIINNGGLVTFSDLVTFSNNTNTTFTGSGATGIKYGFYFPIHTGDAITTGGSFTNCTWSNIEFYNCSGGNGVINPQNDMLVYDGVHDNTKEFYLCKFTNMHLNNCNSFMDNYKGAFTNVMDSCEYSYIVVDNAQQPTVMNDGGIYRANIHHWTLNGCTSYQVHDVGAFMFAGSVNMHHNTRTGFWWGWFIRLSQCSLNKTGDSYFYDNIDLGSIMYGFIDYRFSTFQAGTPSTNGGNVYVYNNTVGNYTNSHIYCTVVFLDYGHPGYNAYVYNNLRFNCTNYGGIPDSANIVNYGGPTNGPIYSGNNFYSPNPIANNVLSDTVACMIKAGSPVIDAGINTGPLVKDDIGGVSRPQGKAYDIGAREYNQNTPPPPNKAPVAITGGTQTITLPTNSATLDGSKSMDSDGTISKYVWAQVSGPSSSALTNGTTSIATASGLVQGTYIYQLTVTDNQGATGKANDTVIVKAATKQPPVAVTGAKQTITLPTNTASLDGTKSYETGGKITGYAWTQVSGPASTLTNASAATASVSGLTQGTFIYQLTVTDSLGATAKANDTIVVNAAVALTPVAVTGAKQTITLPTNTSSLDGTKSYETGGKITSYAWSQVSGPASTLTNASAATANVSGLTQGTFIYQLTVTDSLGATAKANDTIVVNAAGTLTPVAVTGAKQTITLPTNTASLDGTKSYETGGKITGDSWTQVSGPASTLTNASAATANVSGLTQGTFIYQLTVTDSLGATAKANDTIVVKAVASLSPVAVTGAKQTITLPTNTASLDGTKSYETGGKITGYAWTQVSGPSSTLTNGSTATASVSGLTQGTFIYQLTVTDSLGATAKANDTIVVNTAANQPPVAVTGAKQTITLPANSATLDGSKSYDPDGSISVYAWTQMSGPSANLTNASTATASVSGLVQGTYIFKLTVTDNLGAVGSALDTVVVNAAANQPPVAVTNAKQTITLPTNNTTLNGSSSYDPDGTISSYAWSQVAGPAGASISSASSASTAISGLQQGNYIFKLTVTDNQGATASALDTVVVHPAATSAPVADAGYNQTIILPTNSAALSGSGSYDSTSSIKTYAWTEVSGPSTAGISSAAGVNTNVSSLQQGVYVFQLQVTDNNGLTATSQVSVTVDPAVNQPPVANAGPNQTISLPGTVTLDGSKSSDPDGTIAAYNWSQVSGPGAAVITNAGTVNPTVSGLQAGVYTFQLQVTDNGGATATAQVTITVNAANQPPVANAGSAVTITLPTSSVNLDGSQSYDPDGTIASYSWTLVSGPSTPTITNAHTVKPSVSGLIAGSYVFKLVVTDNQGATGTDQVTVTVNAAAAAVNQPPVASAGSNITITLPTNSTTLDGSLSHDPDGTIVAYTWTQVSGPSTATWTGANTASPTVGSLVVGSYTFQLTVTDNQGATATSQVTVMVDAAGNKPPVANAGSNITLTLPDNSTSLDGSLSYDPDGTIVAYTWTQVSGPSTATWTAANSASPVVGSLVAGVYVFELKVTDNQAATGTSQVTVTVNAAQQLPVAPLANAGQDTTIALPANSVELNGSGSSDASGNITTYQWTQVSGPANAQLSTSASALTTASNLVAGDYVFQLTVTNSQGISSTAIVKVSVVETLRYVSQSLLYPNPAQNVVHLRLVNDTTGTIRVNIFDAGGQLIQVLQLEKTGAIMDKTINVGGLASGIYIVQVTLGTKPLAVFKLLKQ